MLNRLRLLTSISAALILSQGACSPGDDLRDRESILIPAPAPRLEVSPPSAVACPRSTLDGVVPCYILGGSCRRALVTGITVGEGEVGIHCPMDRVRPDAPCECVRVDFPDPVWCTRVTPDWAYEWF